MDNNIDIKDMIDSQINSYYDISGIATMEDATDYSGTNNQSFRERAKMIKEWIKQRLPVVVLSGIWITVILHAAWMIMTLAMAVVYLDEAFLDENIGYAFFWCGGAFFAWAISTQYDFWNYKRRKICSINIAIINLCIYITLFFIKLSLDVVVPVVLLIPTNLDITIDMVISLARLVGTLVALVPSIAVLHGIVRLLNTDENKQIIMEYRIDRHWDRRKGKRYKYDWMIVRNKENGKYIRVREEDRSLHAMADGTTGTAKTAGVFTPGIVNDLDRKVRNEDVLKRKLLKMVKKKELVLREDFDDSDFSINHFISTSPKAQKKFEKITACIRSAGMTTLAPNASFADTIYEFATKRGIKVNRVDPMLIDGKHKPGFIGFNPLYINPELSGIERKIEIFSKASLFADVSQAIYELNGKGDPYFTSLNRNISTTIIILLELTMQDAEGRQPTPADVQEIINDFERVKKYLDVLKHRQDSADYSYVIDIIEKQLLGESAKKIAEQATGLKIIINELLMHPLVKSVLCAEKSVDMDRALAEGQVILVNYALELGQSQATAFGLFFSLNFNNAVLRRKGNEKTRLPHYFYIDEFPFLLHPRMEQCFTMFRQYGVSTCVALQTLDQLDKNEQTRYMRNVLLGNTAHQIFFGRMSPTEMELLEKMGGQYTVLQEQDTVSEQALSVENTSITMSKRTSKTKESRLEGGNVRYKEFMEVTFFTVLRGTAMLPLAGKVNFVENYKKSRVRRYRVNWHKLYDSAKAAELNKDIKTEKSNDETTVQHTVEASVNIMEKKKSQVQGTVVLKNNKNVFGEEVSDTQDKSNNAMDTGYVNIEEKDIFNLEEELR